MTFLVDPRHFYLCIYLFIKFVTLQIKKNKNKIHYRRWHLQTRQTSYMWQERGTGLSSHLKPNPLILTTLEIVPLPSTSYPRPSTFRYPLDHNQDQATMWVVRRCASNHFILMWNCSPRPYCLINSHHRKLVWKVGNIKCFSGAVYMSLGWLG